MSVSKLRSHPRDGWRPTTYLSAAGLVASFIGWCGTADADSSPQPPSAVLHGYYWKHSALILPVAGDDVRSVAIESNADTGMPPLVAVGGIEGVVVYAYKSLVQNTPPSWHKEATLLAGLVSLSGNRLAIGTPDNGAGHVQVYTRAKSGIWSAMGTPVYPPVQALAEEFGRSLELDGDTLVVGMPNLDTGKAYIFELQRNNQWAQTAELGTEPGIAVPGSHFGGTVGVSDGYVLVAQLPPSAPGVVYEYHKDGGAWSLSQTLTARDPANPTQPALASDLQAQQFGKTFEVRGTELAVRSKGYVQMFDREPIDNTWTYSETFSAGPTMPILTGRDLRSIAFDGKSLLIGEPLAEKNGIVAGRVRPRLGPYAYPMFPIAYLPGVTPDNSIRENPLEADVQFGKVTAVDGSWLIVGDNDHARLYRMTAY